VLERFEAWFLAVRHLAAFVNRLQVAGTVACHGEDGMRQEVQRKRSLRQNQPDGIDEERHVVIDHFNDGVCRRVSVLALRGIEHPNQRAAAAPARQVQVGHGDGDKFLRVAPGKVFGLDVGVIRAQERLQLRPAAQRGGQCLAQCLR
jgi:hypothetical protein